MRLPTILYGRYSDAASAARKAVTKVARGASWLEAFGPETVDSESLAGLFLLAGPNPLLGGQPHFQLFLPHLAIANAMDRGKILPQMEEQIFAQSLEAAWSLLGLMSQPNIMWVYKKQRYKPFLQSTQRFWGILEAVGPRYSVGMASGQLLWSLPSNLKYVLANSGIGNADLVSPLSEAGIDGFIEQLR